MICKSLTHKTVVRYVASIKDQFIVSRKTRFVSFHLPVRFDCFYVTTQNFDIKFFIFDFPFSSRAKGTSSSFKFRFLWYLFYYFYIVFYFYFLSFSRAKRANSFLNFGFFGIYFIFVGIYSLVCFLFPKIHMLSFTYIHISCPTMVDRSSFPSCDLRSKLHTKFLRIPKFSKYPEVARDLAFT